MFHKPRTLLNWIIIICELPFRCYSLVNSCIVKSWYMVTSLSWGNFSVSPKYLKIWLHLCHWDMVETISNKNDYDRVNPCFGDLKGGDVGLLQQALVWIDQPLTSRIKCYVNGGGWAVDKSYVGLIGQWSALCRFCWTEAKLGTSVYMLIRST